MLEWINAQTDFYLFTSGFLYVVLATGLLREKLCRQEVFGWAFYGFALLAGMHKWIENLVLYGFNIPFVDLFDKLVFLASSLFLFEFSRRFAATIGFKIRAGIYGPLLVALGLATALGLPVLEQVGLDVVFLIASLLTVIVVAKRGFGVLPFIFFFSSVLITPPSSILCISPELVRMFAVGCLSLHIVHILIQNTTIKIQLPRWFIWIFIVTNVVLLTICLLLMNWRTALVDHQLRNNLLKTALNISQTIETNLIKDLSYTKKDYDNPSFQLIEEQQKLYGQFGGFKSIYSMALKDNKIIFGPENIPHDDPVASAPGTVYEQPRKEDWNAFITRQPYTVGPVKDEYGTFVSAGAPVIDPKNNEILFVLGIDIQAKQWQEQIFLNRCGVMIITGFLLVFVLLGGCLVYGTNLEGIGHERAWRGQLAVFLFSGLIISFGISALIFENNQINHQTVFNQVSLQKLSIFRNQIDEIKYYLLPNLVSELKDQNARNRSGFEMFSREIITNHAIASCGFLPRVLDQDRDNFEVLLKAELGPEAMLFTKDKAGRRVEQLRQKEYYPFYLVEPYGEMKKTIGFDTLSSPERREAIEGALYFRHPYVTDPLVRVSTGEPALTVYSLVEDTPAAKESGPAPSPTLAGVAFVTIRPKEIIKSLDQDISVVGRYNIDLFQLRKNMKPLWVASNHVEKLPDLKEIDHIKVAGAYLSEYYPVMFFGKTYILRIYSNDREALKIGLYYGVIPFVFCLILVCLIVFVINKSVNYRRNLERELEQRTFSLNEAKKAAEAANQSKSEFLANMSHEIRTPMNAVMGYSELLKHTPLTGQQKSFLDIIGSSGQLLCTVINDILDFSKLESHKMALEELDFDLEHLVYDVFKIAQVRFKSNKISSHIDYDPLLPRWVKGDPTRLRQIILNFLSNSAKFTDQGEISLLVTLQANVHAGPVVQFCIQDTGIGIAEDKKSGLFNAFHQADTSTTRKYGGTGLGLAISKRLIEAMRGKVWFESTLGQGSKFFFSIPLMQGTALVDQKIDPVPLAKLIGKKIICLDPNESFLEVVNRYCRQYKLDVVGLVSNPSQFMETLKSGICPDVILMETVMPQNDGYALAEEIRRHKEYDPIKIIALSSDVQVGTANLAKQKGFDGFLTKPIRQEDLIRVIATVLGDHRPEASAIITRHLAQEIGLKGIKILVVDDSQANRQLMEIYLKMLGCIIGFATNGQEAIDQLKQDKDYAMVLMDLQMPVMGGIEATEIIRRDISKEIPVLAVTAAVMKEDRDRAFQAGVNGFLTKPIDLNKLKETIASHIIASP